MWITEWKAISDRILALVDAGAFFFRTNDSDMFNASNVLVANGDQIVSLVGNFFSAYGNELSPAAKGCVEKFLSDYRAMFQQGSNPNGFAGVTGVLTYLVSFRAEFEYLISDTQALTRSLVVRALTHLQWSIIADKVVRERWKQAFEDGEPACESLGACHLLLHGVWGFKANGKGERTDLVLNEPITLTDDIRRGYQGLVLTEWKKVNDEGELSKKLADAQRQAALYGKGILAGFELRSPRYIIIVSRDRMAMPSPAQDGEVTYEFRNVAVEPSTPSRA